MDAHYSVELPYAFIVGEDGLKRLANLLSDRIGDLRICIKCADDVEREFKNVKELAAFENPKGKEIRQLRISALSDDFKKRAMINLSGSRWRGISLDFEARDEVVSRLRADVLELIGEMRPWYDAFHRIDFESIMFLAFVLIWFSLLIVIAFKWVRVDDAEAHSARASAIGQLVIFGGIVALITIGAVLNRFRDSLFPRAVFLIGQGKARFKNLERIQWGIIIPFIVSFVAGVVILAMESDI